MYIHRIVHIYTHIHTYTYICIYILFFQNRELLFKGTYFHGFTGIVNPRYYNEFSEFHLALSFKTWLPGKGQQGYHVFCPCRKLFMFFSAKICQVISQPMLTKCLFNMVQNVRKDKDIGHAAFSADVIR